VSGGNVYKDMKFLGRSEFSFHKFPKRFYNNIMLTLYARCLAKQETEGQEISSSRSNNRITNILMPHLRQLHPILIKAIILTELLSRLLTIDFLLVKNKLGIPTMHKHAVSAADSSRMYVTGFFHEGVYQVN
jgi:hypothetical protein